MSEVSDILQHKELSKENIVRLLSIDNKEEQNELFKHAYSVKKKNVGKLVYTRGLIELSNICNKNCLYCGIRAGNSKVIRYSMSDDEVMETIAFAKNNKFNNVVIQSGENCSEINSDRIENLIKKIKINTNSDFRITLSLGEQSEETYNKWFDAGAQRYLLRIETSSKELYYKIHPLNHQHNYEKRLDCLYILKKIGYQVGTGVMIGLPFQTNENLADDLLFIKNKNIVMVGMGPYLEHEDTPLYTYKDLLLPLKERFYLSLRMIAVLRIIMKDINIASTTALQSIEPMGREKGLKVGANVIMPNITPKKYRENYLLYENKPCIKEEADDCIDCLEKRISMIGEEIDYESYGDSKRFLLK
jgi:biotin synthase